MIRSITQKAKQSVPLSHHPTTLKALSGQFTIELCSLHIVPLTPPESWVLDLSTLKKWIAESALSKMFFWMLYTWLRMFIMCKNKGKENRSVNVEIEHFLLHYIFEVHTSRCDTFIVSGVAYAATFWFKLVATSQNFLDSVWMAGEGKRKRDLRVNEWGREGERECLNWVSYFVPGDKQLRCIHCRIKTSNC